MGITNDLLDLLTDTVTWNKLQTRNAYGEPTFTTVGSYPARVVRKNKLTRNKDAQQVVSTAQCWMGPSLTSGEPFPLVSVEDQVRLSDGKTPQIASIEIFQDELSGTEGPSHTVVYFL